MMLICVESGMSIEMAFAKVGAEVGTASCRACRRVAADHGRAFISCKSAAWLMRISRAEPAMKGVKAVTMALIQAERYGTPLGDALARNVEREPRDADAGGREESGRACRHS